MICNLWDFVYAHSTSKEVHPTPWKHLAAIVTTVIIKLYIIDVYIYIYIIDEHISHAIVYQIIKLYKYVFIHIWSFLTCILYTTYYIILYICTKISIRIHIFHLGHPNISKPPVLPSWGSSCTWSTGRPALWNAKSHIWSHTESTPQMGSL